MTLYSGPTDTELTHIPAVLTERRQWVLWRGEDRVDEQTGEIKGLNKIPIDPLTLRNADTTDLLTWGTYQQCAHALPVALEGWEHDNPATARGGGLGFVFTGDDPFCGVDLDHCVSDTGELEPWAQEHVEQLGSYTEVTPSSTGLHILVQGSLPPHGRKKDHVEMYDQMRFFTMTGWHLPGTPLTIEPRQDALTAFHLRIFGTRQAPQPPGHAPGALPLMDDATLLERATRAKNGAKFSTLWTGDWRSYGSQSEADLALCSMLAFWSRGHNEQIDRLFRQCGLMREKWDEHRGELTYGERTIQEALARQTEHYRFRRQSARQTPHASNTPQTDNPAAPAPAAWTNQLLLNKKDIPTENLSNLLLLLEHHPDWHGRFWWDTVRTKPMCGDTPVDETLLSDIALWCGTALQMSIRSLRLLETAVRRVCLYRARDVLQEWLYALPAWDGVERLTEWLSDVASVPKTPYSMELARLLPVSMVARALNPGCQYRYVVILEGAEDSGKSKLVKTLASPAWYREYAVSMESKEAHMLLQGAWVAELGELATLSRTEEAKLKSFITLEGVCSGYV